jgi:hypothetical protein
MKVIEMINIMTFSRILSLVVLCLLNKAVKAVPKIFPYGILRGGNSGTRFGPVGIRKQASQKQQFFPIVEDLAKDDENQEMKNIVSSFLSRDDRNTFIGKRFFKGFPRTGRIAFTTAQYFYIKVSH